MLVPSPAALLGAFVGIVLEGEQLKHKLACVLIEDVTDSTKLGLACFTTGPALCVSLCFELFCLCAESVMGNLELASANCQSEPCCLEDSLQCTWPWKGPALPWTTCWFLVSVLREVG